MRTKASRVERQAEDQERDESDDAGMEEDATIKDNVYVFRFVSVTSIDEFWNSHLNRDLAGNVKSLLIPKTPDDDPGTDSLRIELNFPEDVYKKAKHMLEGNAVNIILY